MGLEKMLCKTYKQDSMPTKELRSILADSPAGSSLRRMLKQMLENKRVRCNNLTNDRDAKDREFFILLGGISTLTEVLNYIKPKDETEGVIKDEGRMENYRV